VAQPTEAGPARAPPADRQSHGRDVRLRRGVQEPRSGRVEEGHHGADDQLARVVAGRLRPLRSVLHPHGLAQRRHLPHSRWSRRRRLRHAAFRAAQQLARQRESRQGAQVALADQAEVRTKDLLGRLDDPHRHPGARVDGHEDFGFGGGREDVYEGDEDMYWGPEDVWLADERYSGDRDSKGPSARCRWDSST